MIINMPPTADFGIIGLGKIGGNLVHQALDKNMAVAGSSRHEKPEFAERGLPFSTDTAEFIGFLKKPRIIFIYVPAGKIVDAILEDLQEHLEEGDIVIDGGNSFFRDSMERAEELEKQGIYFLDCGTSGGIPGARNGACFMIGGPNEPVQTVMPVLEKLAVKDGVVHTGESGSGHYVKLVHNGIEFGMLQAIGEGLALLESGEFNLNPPDVLYNWSHGSVIRSWLVELLEAQLREKSVGEVPDYIEDTGEVNWLVEEALKMEVPIPAISQAVTELLRSRVQQSVDYQAIAMMRNGFGEHPFGPDEDIRKERREGKRA